MVYDEGFNDEDALTDDFTAIFYTVFCHSGRDRLLFVTAGPQLECRGNCTGSGQ